MSVREESRVPFESSCCIPLGLLVQLLSEALHPHSLCFGLQAHTRVKLKAVAILRRRQEGLPRTDDFERCEGVEVWKVLQTWKGGDLGRNAASPYLALDSG